MGQNLRWSRKWTGFPSGTSGKEPTCQCRRHKRHGFNPWVGKVPWRRAGQPTPVFLPVEFNRQMSLVGYSPWGRRAGHNWSNLAHTRTRLIQPMMSKPLFQENYYFLTKQVWSLQHHTFENLSPSFPLSTKEQSDVQTALNRPQGRPLMLLFTDIYNLRK